jgi:hypothetical protein
MQEEEITKDFKRHTHHQERIYPDPNEQHDFLEKSKSRPTKLKVFFIKHGMNHPINMSILVLHGWDHQCG